MSKEPTYEELKRKIEDLEKGSAIRRFIDEELLTGEVNDTGLAEYIADGISLIQDEKILYVNDAFASIYGYSDPSQLVGKKAIDLFSPEYQQPYIDVYRALISGSLKAKVFQAKGIARNGHEFWVERHYSILYWKGKLSVLATARDITESKTQEIAIMAETEHLRKANIKLRGTLKDRFKFGDLVGKSGPMQEIYTLILEAAASNSGVVLYGESGTGKELIARTIHDMSDRHEKAFVPVNCGAVPETIFENEFFGHRKGAFTSADSDKPGFFDKADGGTLFLDEVSELTTNMQVKLLRALEGGGYTPVGGNRVKHSDVRIITATNEELKHLLKTGSMRRDFFYRIHIIPIDVPSLRARKEDIPLLVDHFLTLFSGKNEKAEIPGDKMETLCNYSWPGNIRELQNVIQRYITIKHLNLMSEPEPIDRENDHDPSRPIPIPGGDPAQSVYKTDSLNLRSAVRDYEKRLILQALDQAHWNRSRAAALLSIPLRTLSRKIKELRLL